MDGGGGMGLGGFAYRPPKLNPDQLPDVSIEGDQLVVGGHSKREKAFTHPLLAYTAATPRGALHPSGWKADITLDRQGRPGTGEQSTWRSGDKLSGIVTLSSASGAPGAQPTSVVVRAFCQCTTLYWIPFTRDTTAKVGGGMNQLKADMSCEVEWNRSFVGGREGVQLIQYSQAAADESDPSQGRKFSYAFDFVLPETVKVDEANEVELNLPERQALLNFARTPPASLPPVEGKNGSIEWTIELLAQFNSDSVSPPSFADGAVPPLSASNSPFGLAQSTESLLVHRIVFPFEPSDLHSQDLYSAWTPTVTGPRGETVQRYRDIPRDQLDLAPRPGESIVPRFAKDPRDEPLGGAAMGSNRPLHGSLVSSSSGGRGSWSSYEKRSTTTNFLGKTTGTIIAEGSLPRPATIARHASSLPILLSITYEPPSGKDGKKGKSVTLESATVVFARRTLTRGGAEHLDHPHVLLDELRRQEFKLGQSITLGGGGDTQEVKLELDLQGEGAYTYEGKEILCQPLKNLGLSIRAPNVEREYFISVQVKLDSDKDSFFLIRAPVQVIAGDREEAPAFEEVARAGGGEVAVANGPAVGVGVGDAKVELPTYQAV